SLLTIWNTPTAAEPTIESVPPAVLEGKNVLLLAHNLPDNLSAYYWFKGKEPLDKDLIIMHEIKSQETKQGKLYSGRETLYSNGSLMLQNVTLKQSGIYNLNIHSAESDQKSMFVEVSVYSQLSKPSIRSNGTTAVEGQDTVELTCDPPFLKTTYMWRLNGKELPGDNNVSLSRGNTTLTLLKVSRHFKGRYECEVQNPLGAFRSNPFTLDVFYGPDTPQIFPPDKYFEEGKNLWLSCQATSHPKAQYSWNVNGEHWSSRQDVFIHKVNMSNSGLYTCHVNNPTTGRNDFKVKEITIVENLLKPHIQIRNRTVLENHLVDLTCVSENAGVSIWWTFNNERLKATDRVTFSWNNRRLTIRPITKEDAGAYQCEVSNPFISKLSDPVSLAVLYQPSKRNFPMSVSVAATLAVEVLAGLAILGGLAYFVFFKKLNQYGDISSSTSSLEKRHHKEKHKKKQKEQKKEKAQQESAEVRPRIQRDNIRVSWDKQGEKRTCQWETKGTGKGGSNKKGSVSHGVNAQQGHPAAPRNHQLPGSFPTEEPNNSDSVSHFSRATRKSVLSHCPHDNSPNEMSLERLRTLAATLCVLSSSCSRQGAAALSSLAPSPPFCPLQKSLQGGRGGDSLSDTILQPQPSESAERKADNGLGGWWLEGRETFSLASPWEHHRSREHPPDIQSVQNLRPEPPQGANTGYQYGPEMAAQSSVRAKRGLGFSRGGGPAVRKQECSPDSLEKGNYSQDIATTGQNGGSLDRDRLVVAQPSVRSGVEYEICTTDSSCSTQQPGHHLLVTISQMLHHQDLQLLSPPAKTHLHSPLSDCGKIPLLLCTQWVILKPRSHLLPQAQIPFVPLGLSHPSNLQALPMLSPASLLDVQFFIRPSVVLDSQNKVSRVGMHFAEATPPLLFL
ncbi:hypothetical protein A6R68_15770, partial [Neotoma lepida]